MSEDIIKTLVSQHDKLKSDLKEAASLSQGKDISLKLQKFKKHLLEHLDLENNIFYPQLLEKMKKNGMDTVSTKDFIAQMKDIEKAVISFLNQYDSKEKIDKEIGRFKMDLKEIINTLMLRIEGEEEGVYIYWKL